MQILTWTRCALAIACALESFSGCSGSASSPASPPMNPHALGTAPFVSPQADLKNGIYVAEYYGSTIVAYKTRNTHNAPPACTVPFTASTSTM